MMLLYRFTMKKIIVFFFLIAGYKDTSAQSVVGKQMHIYRIKSFYGSLVKLKLNVNGKEVEFKSDTERIIPLENDSITISVLNRRFSKHSSKIQHAAQPANFFIVYPKLLSKPARDVWMIEPVCKECYNNIIVQSRQKQKD
jgi:hypothetical protein